MTSLPEPDFISRAPETIEQAVIATWQSETGLALDPTQPESQLLRVMAYRETLLRIAIQEAAKQNLLRYAAFPVIDHIGKLLAGSDGARLGAQAATTTLRFSLASPRGVNTLVPSGTRVATRDGRVFYATTTAVYVVAGQTSADALATATTTGAGGNGYVPGQVTTLVDPVPYIVAVTNVTATDGGSAVESDAHYSERLLLAPGASSTAGAEETYRFWALTASALVADVAVLSPTPGAIRVVVLSETGTPSSEILAAVTAILTPTNRRPMSDTVTVVAATAVGWTCVAALTLYRDADADGCIEAATQAVDAYAQTRRLKLGRNAVLNQLRGALCVPGVYDVAVTAPADTVEVAEDQWLNCTAITITVGGRVAEDTPSG